MKVPLKRHLNVFSKLWRRLSSAKWLLLLITTAMFFLSMYLSSCNGMCDQQGNCMIALGTTPGSGVQTPPNPLGTASPASQPLTQLNVPTVPALLGVASPTASAAVAGAVSSSGSGGKTMMVTIKQGPPTASDPSGFVFDPASLTIQKGTTVTWTNPTQAEHTVTSDGASFDSGPFPANGKPFSFTFNKTGTVTYHCNDHPGQRGTITVK